MYNSLAEYVHSFGVKIKDLSPEQLEAVKEEYSQIEKGYVVLDGILERVENN